MADNYDNVCSICGKVLNGNTKYYCCPKCYEEYKKKDKEPNEDNPLVKEEKESEVENGHVY